MPEHSGQKKILLITSGQPSLNPRLVKEADALAGAGFEVSVLYTYWNDWGTRHDEQLFAKKKWKAVRVGGDPAHKRALWLLSRLMHKAFKLMLQKTGSYSRFADFAIARASYWLIKAAKQYQADLYIAHNLGALPAAVKTATLHNKPCGFDAEDFHRQELNDDVNSYHYKLSSYIENKYLPSTDYLTASSPLIAEKYAQLYKRAVTCQLNVFPKTAVNINQNMGGPLKLFWFSQMIGPGRGIETIIEAMGICGCDVELHLLGQSTDHYRWQLLQGARAVGLKDGNPIFHKPVPGDELFKIASQFDIGVASETGFSPNNNMALSNKIFTYIQSGLAVAASSTPAQTALMAQYPQAGAVYSNAQELGRIIKTYDENREQLAQTKKAAYAIGQNEMNWDNESRKFLNVVNESFGI